MFEPKKFQTVYEDMRNRSAVLTDFEVGSVARTIYEAFAYEIALLYEKMHLVYLSAYVDTAEGQQLDNVVSVLGIKRGLPDFAEGIATFNRDVGNQDIEIPPGTLITTEDKPDSPKKVYQTFESKTLPKDQTSVEVKVKAVNRGENQATAAGTIVVMPRPIPGIKSVNNNEEIKFLGKRRETDDELRERGKNALISSGKASIIAIENALLSLPKVKDVKVKENFDQEHYGIIETFVSGIDFKDSSEIQGIQAEIDRVRAAGIFVLLKPAVVLDVSGEFTIEIDPNLKLTEDEKAEVQKKVQMAIIQYISELNMGQSMLFSQMIKNILLVDGIQNIKDFTITIRKEDKSSQAFIPSDNRIDIQEFENFMIDKADNIVVKLD